jgi:hypothetical protein
MKAVQKNKQPNQNITSGEKPLRASKVQYIKKGFPKEDETEQMIFTEYQVWEMYEEMYNHHQN